jgi:hypothetical protein
VNSLAGVIRIAGGGAGLLGSWETEGQEEACQAARWTGWNPGNSNGNWKGIGRGRNRTGKYPHGDWQPMKCIWKATENYLEVDCYLSTVST